MNKHISIFIPFLILLDSSSFAQIKIEKFCQVTTHYKAGFNSKRVATIFFGEQAGLFSFKDSTILPQLQKVNELTTETDVLNYMASLGWQLVNFNYTGLYGAFETMYFKKEFDKSELAGE